MLQIEKLLEERSSTFIQQTNDILKIYKDKLNSLMSIVLKKEIIATWNYISLEPESGKLDIHGFIELLPGDTITDVDGFEILITEENKKEFLQYTRLHLTPNQLDTKPVTAIAEELSAFYIKPNEEISAKEFEQLRDAADFKTAEPFDVINSPTISKTKH